MQSQTESLKLREILAAALALVLALVLIAPLTAQDGDAALDELTEEEATIVIGPISFSQNGDIVVVSTDEVTGEVTAYIIAPASAFTPSSVAEGDIVIIMGRLLPDGVTVQAITFEFFVEEEPEATPEATAEATPEATEEPEVTPEATAEFTPEPEVTPEATPEFETCGNTNHPVAARLSEEFGLSVDEIVAMHCDGNGYGNIARALLMAREAGETATAWDFLERHQNGEGWGHIMRESGMHPSEFAPGRIGKGQSDDDGSTDEEAMTTTESNRPGNRGGGNGNGNSNGNGNGNNGGGRGNGNGQGNGNNGGGNGNGNNGGGRGNGGGGGNR